MPLHPWFACSMAALIGIVLFFNFFFKQPRTSWWMLMKKIYQWMLSRRRYPLIWIFFLFLILWQWQNDDVNDAILRSRKKCSQTKRLSSRPIWIFVWSYGNDRMDNVTTHFSAIERSVRRQNDSNADPSVIPLPKDCILIWFWSHGNDKMIMSRRNSPLSKEVLADKAILLQIYQCDCSRRSILIWFYQCPCRSRILI